MKDVIYELQDMRYLNWTRTRKSSGTAGSYLKSYDDTGDKKRYYKLSDYEQTRGIIGHECVNEIVVQRLLRFFGIEHLEYTLIHALVTIDGAEYETYLCETEDYKGPDEAKLSLEDYYAMERVDGESSLDFCKRMGWEQYVYEMFLIDYLVLNRDRHGANIEVLRDRKNKSVRLAPLFDHGLSLVCRCHTKEELDVFDVMKDRKVQSFVGSSSADENVGKIPKEYLATLPKLKKADLDRIFEGLEAALDRDHLDKMREMIRERWRYLERI